jgi:threonine/homoserine/homoserine lactone efflux protein
MHAVYTAAMIAGALLTGGIVGFSIAAPVGPIGALTIRRTLAQGRAAGFLTGLGAATADSAYGAVAAFGLTLVTSFLVAQQGWLSLLGGLFLCWLGVATFRAQPAPIEHTPPARSLLGAYASTVFLTLTNPTTILSFVGIYAGLGLRESGTDYAAASAFVLGVFLGSALWWLLLSFGVGTLRERLSVRGLRWINRISGAAIAAFGLVVLIRLASSG